MNPTAAQIKRMTGGGPQTIVVIHPPVPEETGYVAAGQRILKLAENEWQPLPYTSRLRVEILCAAPTTSELPLFTIAADIKATLETLTLECNPSSPSFGNPDRTSSSGVVFRFADESKIMSKAVLEPLVMFINERFTATKTALTGVRGMDEAIKDAWPGKGWKAIECPVAPSMTNCKTCGKAEDAVAGGNVMQQCGRCKKVRYCGKGCQAEDWKTHKLVCPK
ncbi:hypothetical protein Q7P35_012088 [Cladosporium inversicolor]